MIRQELSILVKFDRKDCLKRQPPPPALCDSDVRAVVRLLGEVAASRGDHSEKKRLLMDGLCDLIAADAWVWTLGCELEPGKQPVYVGFMHGGFDDERFSRYLIAVEHPDMAQLTAPILEELSSRNSHITRLRQQMDRADFFSVCDASVLWEKADIGPLMLSMRPLDQRSFGTMGLYRRRRESPFTERESRIVHIVLSEVPWLHEQGWPEDRGVTVPTLSPRQRLVLNFLLDGRSRKAIADHMAISDNTVSGYTKGIYRHFNVNSHAELMKRFQQGDGGDR